MKLSLIYAGQPEIEIKGLSMDSRKVKEGDIFFCVKGLESDGHRYADAAISNGAVCIIHTDNITMSPNAIYIKVDNMAAEINRVTDLFYEQPSRQMTVFGVTGTNGKTTTTSIISDIYSHIAPCGYMGTIAVRYGNISRIPNLTTPDAIEIHSSLREMVDYNMKAVAMEVSSHGLALHRVDSVDFDVAIFTNLTYDHLDFHKTMEDYFEAKKLLFKNMKKDGVAVLNMDDISFDQLRKSTSCKYVTYGVKEDADYRAEDIKITPFTSEFTLVHDNKTYKVKTNMVALYNIYNLLGAIAGMNQMGMEIDDMLPWMENISQVDGRMETISMGQKFHVVVDYAHTPDGFEKIFQFAKEITPGGKIYSVFGCAGKRDKVKRKVLGQLAGKYCETVIVTEEDPRNESAEEIGKQIISGVEKGNAIFVSDRYEAIEKAMSLAKEGDCVLILGKGDESYMYHEEGRRPWMGDNEAAKQAIKKIVK